MDFSYDFVLKMIIGDSLIPNHEKKKKLFRQISCKNLVMQPKLNVLYNAHIILKNKYVMLNLCTHVKNNDLHLGSNINGKNIFWN
jgi:hypothetical protein